MKSLIITVAGTATRFNHDTDEPTLKCLYHIGSAHNSLLYQILDKSRDFDEYILVGGYLFDKLEAFVNENLAEFSARLKLVYNPEFQTYGSGYSLILGIRAADRLVDEVVFVEGDLYFDKNDFEKVIYSEKNVFTVNHELITAQKAVVVYVCAEHRLHYLYDTTHQCLQIPEPFFAVYNSAQIWKFKDCGRLLAIVDALTPAQMKGTNLEIIQAYFGELNRDEYEMVSCDVWYNCNTVADYEVVYSKITK